METIIKETNVKNVITKSNLPVCDYSVNPYLAAMKAFHDAGIRTTCFISPIFPGITDVEAIIDRVKAQCNLVWLENLNLRGDYKKVILEYIREKHPQLMPMYNEIYQHGKRSYWEVLNN
ncbi:MAG: hypothetical protein MRZ75_07925 [Roseburia sp.]|nr:hypothetical protein [Roseburia sp.]MDY5883154.1 hypothetical protein [Roseburia sp.]